MYKAEAILELESRFSTVESSSSEDESIENMINKRLPILNLYLFEKISEEVQEKYQSLNLQQLFEELDSEIEAVDLRDYFCIRTEQVLLKSVSASNLSQRRSSGKDKNLLVVSEIQII